VKPCQLHDAFHFPILSGSMDFQQFFNCGLWDQNCSTPSAETEGT
jgi:hypothetical protein